MWLNSANKSTKSLKRTERLRWFFIETCVFCLSTSVFFSIELKIKLVTASFAIDNTWIAESKISMRIYSFYEYFSMKLILFKMMKMCFISPLITSHYYLISYSTVAIQYSPSTIHHSMWMKGANFFESIQSIVYNKNEEMCYVSMNMCNGMFYHFIFSTFKFNVTCKCEWVSFNWPMNAFTKWPN